MTHQIDYTKLNQSLYPSSFHIMPRSSESYLATELCHCNNDICGRKKAKIYLGLFTLFSLQESPRKLACALRAIYLALHIIV